MSQPIASVVVVNYNDSEYIPGCLASLLDQDMPEGDYEIVFADNGSSDGSPDVVRSRFPTVRLIEFDRNYGYCVGNNRAVEYASGKYVVLLNVDTVVHRKWLSELIRPAEANEAVKACQPSMIMPWVDEFRPIDRSGFPRNAYYYDLTRFGYAAYRSQPLRSTPFRSLFLEGGSLLVERELVSSPNYVFEPDLGFYCEDLDLALRLNIWGYETVTVPTSVVYHCRAFSMKARIDRPSVSSAIQNVRNRVIAFYKNMTDEEFSLFLPLLLFGAPFKVREFGWSVGKQCTYGLGAGPVVLIGFLRALSLIRKLRGRRQQNLNRRRRGQWWLLNEVVRGRGAGTLRI